MKSLTRLLLAPLLAVALFCLVVPPPLLVAAASTPYSTLFMIGANPTFHADGSLATCQAQAIFEQGMVISGERYANKQQPTISLSWDGTSSTNTITVGGTTLTYAQVFAFVAAIAIAERDKAPGTQSKAAADAAEAAAAAAAQPPANP